jgi:threonine dehydrogenase-like Zn-dependent dehydrogenase
MTGRTAGVRAAVLTAAETLGPQSFPVPGIGEDDALIRVEVCGLGGSDVTQYLGKLRPSSTVYPVILGHVFVGVIESIVSGRSSDARKLDLAKRWGVHVAVDVDSDDVVDVVRQVTGGALAADYSAFERACRFLERDGDLIAQANTHAFGLDEVEAAIHTLAGDIPGADAIGVSVEPQMTSRAPDDNA